MAGSREERYLQTGLWTQERIGWLLSTSAQRWPDRELVNFEGTRYTYNELWRWTTQIARQFIELGFGPNTRVLIQLGNCMELIAAQLACWRIGALCVPVIPIYRSHEVAHILRDCAPNAVISAAASGKRAPYEELEELLKATGMSPKRLLVGGNSDDGNWLPIVGNPPPDQSVTEQDLPDPAPADQCILILYTSGTTSAPKGVMLNSRALLSNLDSWQHTVGLSYRDVFCSGSPLSHIAALAAALLMPMRLGARTALLASWDPDKAVKTIAQEQVTYMSGANVFIHDLVQRYAAGASPEYRLQNFYAGGSPTPPELVEQADALGVRVIRCYGMTETAGTTTSAARNAALRHRAHYDGKVEFGTEMQAVDDNHNLVPPGEVGHIRIRSPKMMIGYTDPEITAQQTDAEGWFYPGDLGSVEADGWFRMSGRTKDIINRGGEKFSAIDIERALSTFPGIRQAAVTGLADERFGEVVAAFITLRASYCWTGPEPVLRHLEGIKLAKAKFPVRWHVVTSLPTSATGKVVKHKLLEMIAANPR